MKSKIKVLTLVLLSMIFLTACQSKQEAIFALPTIPTGYVPDKSLYLADGDGVYAFVDNQAFDYETIGAEICNGNAQAVKLQFEERSSSKENPEEYAAIQNILGITEIYLGDYRQAYERFNDTIDFLNKKNTPKKEEILTALYNNSGAVTVYLSQIVTEDKRLIKAAELCKEPYMALAIAMNQTGRVKTDAPIKENGELIVRTKKLIEIERQIDDSPNFVLFTAARYMSVGYVFTVQEKKAVETLDEYIPLIPETPEYNLIRASLISYRGYCYDNLEEYERAINDFQSAIVLEEKTVDENSRQLARTYNRLGVSYANCEELNKAIVYIEKAIPGCKYATASDKGILYWNVGNVSWLLNQNEKAKKYLLKSYINNQKLVKKSGATVAGGYGDTVKEVLYELYCDENDSTVSFPDWLEKESEQYKAEEDRYDKDLE